MSDPFHIPDSEVPPGMSYQWVNKITLGKEDPQYIQMVEAGWKYVPFARHAKRFKAFNNVDGQIVVSGTVLMERPKYETIKAREKEIDLSFIQMGQPRIVAITPLLRIRVSPHDMKLAHAKNITSSNHIQHEIERLNNHGSKNVIRFNGDGTIRIDPPRRLWMPRSRSRFVLWLARLFMREVWS